MTPKITINHQDLADFCRRWSVSELALFGSVLRDDFRPEESDIDVLVSFLPEADIGLIELSRMQRELVALFDRKVDLVPKAGLKPRIRQGVLDSSQVVSAA